MIFFRFWLLLSLYSGLLLLVYILVLRNRNAHTVSRYYLLLAGILPVLLPFADVNFLLPAGSIAPVRWLREVVVGNGSLGTHTMFSINWWYVYMSVSAVLVIAFIVRVVILGSRTARYPAIYKDGVYIVSNAPYTGSWLRYLLLEPQVTDAAIIAHETAHIRHRHSYDLLFINLISCFTWLSPFSFLLRKELRMVHEFQADEAVMEEPARYANTLLSHVFSAPSHSFIHTFSQHPLKRRIMMLQAKNKPRKTGYRLAIAVSFITTIAAAGIFLQSCKDKAVVTPASQSDEIVTVLDPTTGRQFQVKVNDSASRLGADATQPLDHAEVMPEFNGDIAKYLSTAVKYPEEARAKKIQGRVVVGFVVAADGQIKDVKIIKSPNELLASEALRVISNMPPWKPATQNGKAVSVKYYQPITFRLE